VEQEKEPPRIPSIVSELVFATAAVVFILVPGWVELGPYEWLYPPLFRTLEPPSTDKLVSKVTQNRQILTWLNTDSLALCAIKSSLTGGLTWVCACVCGIGNPQSLIDRKSIIHDQNIGLLLWRCLRQVCMVGSRSLRVRIIAFWPVVANVHKVFHFLIIKLANKDIRRNLSNLNQI